MNKKIIIDTSVIPDDITTDEWLTLFNRKIIVIDSSKCNRQFYQFLDEPKPLEYVIIDKASIRESLFKMLLEVNLRKEDEGNS